MKFGDLLTTGGIDPQQVIVMRHRPSEPELNKILPWLAADRPDVFNAYQQTQGEKVEKAMLGAPISHRSSVTNPARRSSLACTKSVRLVPLPTINFGRYLLTQR
jgi:hypothetical protein